MAFRGILSQPRKPNDADRVAVEKSCPALKDKLWTVLGEETPMNTDGCYNCLGWALQVPKFLNDDDADYSLNRDYVMRQFQQNGYTETTNRDEAEIEVYHDSEGKIVHFTRFYKEQGNRKLYSSKLGFGGYLIIHYRGEIDGPNYGYAAEYYKSS